MKYIWNVLAFILACCSTLSADFCREVAQDLKVILEKTEGIKGVFESIEPLPGQGGSFINQVYLVTTDQGEKFVLKVENTNWKNEKTINEVRTLKFLDQFTSIPVPKVVAYENVIDDSLIGREYILMTLVRGAPLNFAFEKIYSDPCLYHNLLEQLADILAEIGQYNTLFIGSLDSADSLQLKCPMDFANLGYDTPCRDFAEYAHRWLSYYLKEMKTLLLSGHQNTKYFEKYIPYIEALLCSPNLSRLNKADEIFPFAHQDFVMKNILVEDAKVMAVLDWEWSGTAPVEFEAKTGCDFLKTPQDIALFNSLLEKRGIHNFFKPPHYIRQIFYRLMGDLYTLISCYEWVGGKLTHSAKFLSQKLEQRHIRASNNFDMQAYVEKVALSLDDLLNDINKVLECEN